MNTKPETKLTKNEEIETIQTADLEDVTGGCAACGCGNPGPGAASPTSANPAAANRTAMSPFFSGFNRR
jgi:hypothetical protein